jgi:RHS repeat-associated protein
LKTKTVHQTSAGTVTVRKRFEYDHAGRLVKTYQQNNLDSEIMLAQNTYNELGTLVEKKLHSTNGGTSALQTVNYAYNIRGWLTQVNDPSNLTDPQNPNADLFAMKLHYETVDANIAGAAQFNGNISQQIWATSTAARHAYGYSYDQLNQLSIAEYEKYAGSWNQDAGRFNESATYDLNGNILTMIRGGKTGASSYGPMDNITMAYAGNKLIGANDAVTNVTGNHQFHEALVSTVVEGNTSTHEYLYDVNGNMIEDKNKHMTVAYNYLNLPTTVDFGSGNKIEWTYTVTGAKLRKAVYSNGSLTLTQDYVSGFVYKNGSLDFFAMEFGRVKGLPNGTFQSQFIVQDHLGNTRLMFADTNGNGSAEVIEESHYYAFGMRIEGLSTSNPDNKFTYIGKELEDDHGLNWYHYGSRYYDPQIGRWQQIDPEDEFQTPYGYVGNNPVRSNDPDGMSSEDRTTAPAPVSADAGPPGIRDVLVAGATYAKAFWVRGVGVEALGMLSLGTPQGQGALAQEMLISGTSVIGVAYQASKFLNSIQAGHEYILDLPNKTLNDIAGDAGELAGRTSFRIGVGLALSKVPVAGDIQIPVYRSFGGESRALGTYWSPVNPKLYGSFYRNFAGLPNGNTAAFTIQGTTPLRNVSKIGFAAPLDSNFGRLVPEVRLIDKTNVTLRNFWVNH